MTDQTLDTIIEYTLYAAVLVIAVCCIYFSS